MKVQGLKIDREGTKQIHRLLVEDHEPITLEQAKKLREAGKLEFCEMNPVYKRKINQLITGCRPISLVIGRGWDGWKPICEADL